MSQPVALVPAKSLATAKGRLSAVLSPAARAALAQRMLAHVLTVLVEAGIEERVVVTGDPMLADLAARHGAVTFDPRTNADLNAAAAAGVAYARAPAQVPVLLLAADLPWLLAADVTQLLTAENVVAIGEAKDGGTNALFLPPGVTLPFAFATGTASAERHALLAREAGHGVDLVQRWGLAQDIDTPADLSRLAGEHPAYRDFLHAA